MGWTIRYLSGCFWRCSVCGSLYREHLHGCEAEVQERALELALVALLDQQRRMGWTLPTDVQAIAAILQLPCAGMGEG